MILTPVESTTLTGLAYDMANGLLYLEFRDQAIYRYSDVPACVCLVSLTAFQSVRQSPRYLSAYEGYDPVGVSTTIPPTDSATDPIYRSPQLARIAASIGILIVHTPPYQIGRAHV